MDSDLDNGEGLVGSPINETEALMEADEEGDLLEERTKSMDSTDGGERESETSKLLNNAEPHPSRQEQQLVSSAEPKSPREFSYAYHFKKKYTFRSDSVYSDVTPMSSAPLQQSSSTSKNAETRDKSGSLSSLKGSQSKWVSLKKKLGKINSLSSGKSKASSSSSQEDGSQAASTASAAPTSANSGGGSGKPIKSLAERRSFLQRAKTLSILPINSAPKKEPPQPKKVVQPPELFNVGGEMNLIPLEMLIDINDIKRPQ